MIRNIVIKFLGSMLLGGCDSGPAAEDSNVVKGLHVLSEYGEKYKFVSGEPDEKLILETMNSLDWANDFHQVILVVREGVSLEVGGSLDSKDGLSSVYRDLGKRDYWVTKIPPNTAEEMNKLLLSFHREDGKWLKLFEYEKNVY